jgi:hypothetical protein
VFVPSEYVAVAVLEITVPAGVDAARAGAVVAIPRATTTGATTAAHKRSSDLTCGCIEPDFPSMDVIEARIT